MKLYEFCSELRNFFIKSDDDKKFNIFTIKDGQITPSLSIAENQYYRIIGSIFNDGVHQKGVDDNDLIDETFDGAIWLMYIPKDVIELFNEINEWQIKYSDAVYSPFNSESFAGYSYSKSGAGSSSSQKAASWVSIFSNRLNKWRKI